MSESKSIGHEGYWRERAKRNLDEWGEQDIETLLLAAQEELGELTQAHLEAKHEGAEFREMLGEVDDLGALCWQIAWALEAEEFGAEWAEARTTRHVFHCGGCERVFDRPLTHDQDNEEYDEKRCPFCGNPTTSEETKVRTVAF